MPILSQVSEYRKDIDGLRAFAVIIVIINHLNHELLPGGYLGVDIFFVISGYVITSSLERTYHSSLGNQLIHFYSRRIKRLTPALLVMILITSAIIRLFNPDALVSTLTGVVSVFGLSNFFLFTQAMDYFGASAQLNPFSHTWSLAVEEQFYFLYPFLIRWRTPRANNSFFEDRFRLAALTVLSAISLLLFVGVYDTNQPAAYFLMPFRFWELGIGCLLALVTRVYENKDGSQPIIFGAAISLFAMITAIFIANKYPIFSTIIVALSTAMLINSIRNGTILYRLFSNKLVSYVGAISYSLYLWHWPVISVSRWTIGIHLWSLPFQIAAILVLSMASYHLIESPLRRVKLAGGGWGVVAAGLLAMAATSLVIGLSQRYSIPAYSGDKSAEVTLNAPVPGYVGRYSKRQIDDCFANNIFGSNEHYAQETLNKCTADVTGKPRFIFIGDSHATDLFPMADKLYRDGVASVLNVSQPGCLVPASATAPKSCNYPNLILKKMADIGNGENIIVIRNNYSPRILDGSLNDFSNRLEKLLDDMSQAGLRVIYVAPAPKYHAIGPDSVCSQQWFRPEWAMQSDCRNSIENRGEQLARRRDVTTYLLGLSQRRSDFFVFDPFDVLCGGKVGDCTPVRNGRLIYRDDSHLTEEGSELMAATFEAFLRMHNLIGSK